MDILVTAKVIPAALKSTVPLFTRFYDMFRPEAEIVFEIKGSNYEQRSVPFFWLYSKEKGATLKVTIKGKPGVCQAIAGHMISTALKLKEASRLNQNNIKSFFEEDFSAPTILEVKPVIGTNWSMFSDVFRFQTSLEFKLTGKDYEKKKYSVFYSKETGQSISVTIKGKPFFVESCSNFINENSEIIKTLFFNTKLLD